MIDGQSEQSKIKKAMKAFEIAASDKQDFADCKKDLMNKIAMDDNEAYEIAVAIRDMFLPKLLKSEGLTKEDMPEDFDVKMTDTDDEFANDSPKDTYDSEDCNDESPSEDHVNEFKTGDSEINEGEIAKIQITVPVDKVREIEKALETILGDTDATSQDQANVHDNGENDMTQKEIEAQKELRKMILAAMADDESQSVSRKDGFDHDKSEQYREEEFYDTKKGDLTDPEHTTLDFKSNKIPSYSDVVDNHMIPDLGLHDTLETFKFSDTPVDVHEYKLDFNSFEVPSQGDTEMFNQFSIESENPQPHKRTINSSTLGNFDADAAEEALAFALKTAGVEDEDLGKLTYAEGLELFKAIKTAQAEDRVHYSKDGKLPSNYNNPKDPDKKAVTEDGLRDNSPKEEDPEKDHERSGPKELYSSKEDAYASMLRKLMKGASEEVTSGIEIEEPSGAKVKMSESKDDEDAAHHRAELDKKAELNYSRIKTAFTMAARLAVSGHFPINEMESHANSMLEDGLSVNAMIRQTKLMIESAANHSERLAANNSSKRVVTSGVGFNPSVGGTNVDLSGASDIQNALKNIGWTTPTVMEDK